jgi:hypothetical protein
VYDESSLFLTNLRQGPQRDAHRVILASSRLHHRFDSRAAAPHRGEGRMAQGAAMSPSRCLALAAVIFSSVATAAPEPGDVIFTETFDSFDLASNASSLPGGWTVTDGTIDVIGQGGFDPQPGHGRYIDMQGSSRDPGQLSIAIPIEVSGVYSVRFNWAGNPQGGHGAIRVNVDPGPHSDGC